MKDNNRLAVIGAAALPVGWYPDRLDMDAALHVTRMAISDAGIDKKDIGAVFIAPPVGHEWLEYHLTCARLVDEFGLGLNNKYNGQVQAGNASLMPMLGLARGVMTTEDANCVLVVHSQSVSRMPLRLPPDAIKDFYRDSSRQYLEWEFPYGMTSDGRAAMVAQRYMNETGTTPEQLASVVVSHRKWAQMNADARFNNAVTIKDVLDSEIVANPLHDLECSQLSDAASAFILTSAEKAKNGFGRKPVYILGEGCGGCTHFSMVQKPDKDITRIPGLHSATEKALQEAKVKLDDIAVVEALGGYPVFSLLALEEMGYCRRGEAGKFVMEGNTWPDGKLPMCTNGGALSAGYAGYGAYLITLYESVLQLREEAKNRQVKGAELAMCVFEETEAFMQFDVAVLGNKLT